MFKTIIEPRVSETDGVGHINNTTIPVWFEAGRNPLFKLFMPDSSFDNWKMIILKMNVEYVNQTYYGTPVAVHCWVTKMGNSSLQLYEELWQDGNLCAKGTATYVNYNVKEKKAETIPQLIREELQTHYYPEGAPEAN